MIRRGLTAVTAALVCAACAPASSTRPAPIDRFYFPGALLHVDVPGTKEGMLYVASTNFDRRYDEGVLLPVMLDEVSGDGRFLPPLGAGGELLSLTDLNIPETAPVFLRHFPGDLARYVFPDGRARLFLPSRGEKGPLQIVDAPTGKGDLTCAGQSAEERDCSKSAPSLTANETRANSLPRAPSPMGVAVSQSRGEVYVSHLQLADNPVGSGQQATAYFIRNPVEALSVPDESFFPVGAAGVHAIVVGSRYAFLTGRLVSPAGPTLRAVDLNEPTRWLAPSLEDDFRVLEARGLALTADETRLYIVGRSPDTLLVVDIEGAATSDLKMRVGRGISLPAGANQVRLIPRVGQGHLVAVTCSTAGVVVLYDEESGDLIAQVPSVGEQPFGLTVDQQGNAARLYVSNFEDGRIAVIDIPDLTRPAPRLVAHLGERQTCVVKPKDALCVGSSL